MKIIYYFLVFITVKYILYSTNENVIAYYPFDNENCLDYSGNHYDGKPINNPTYVPGVSGKAIHLVGKGNFINKGQSVSLIGSYVELPFIDYSKYSNLTISLWVRFQNLSGVWGNLIIILVIILINGLVYSTQKINIYMTTFFESFSL
ncbi:MAG: hypothetical protein ACPL1A_08815 [Candidatus Kapaibacteriota bacterium]